MRNVAAEFDLDEGQGVDEEVCLLPDEEREISDADKERAILAKEAAEKEHEEAGGDGDGDADVDGENDLENDKDGEATIDESNGTFIRFLN